MTDREILINSLQKGVNLAKDKVRGEGEAFSWGDVADYLLANGVIVPPCKVGDTVYFLDAICVNDSYCINNCCCIDCKYAELQVCEIDFDLSMYKEIGKTVFLTKEEAEKALAERSGDNGN